MHGDFCLPLYIAVLVFKIRSQTNEAKTRVQIISKSFNVSIKITNYF